ncbi:MAG: ATP-binding cassette domain-containing protein [Gammaproteobacteria bacterium]|nr:ATP-binding cassette domain-containing protein [Gammaproteobacteria bacterium]MDE2345516.1 ATP-binding cassette domain-containing protein [Gammaproteobacteria bacterium]
MNAQAILQAEKLRISNGEGEPCACSLDLEIPAARLVALVGPAGAGKSTWLRTLAAVDPPAGGRLSILGEDASNLNETRWRQLRCRAAFVTMGAPLLSVVDGLTNLMLPALYHRTGNAEQVRAQAEEILDFLGYAGDTHTLPAYLNQHQRLLIAIGRCLMLAPQLMFLDEPFYMTDDASRRNESGMYRRLAQERGMAILVATHNLGFVKRFADQIVFVQKHCIWKFENWQAFAASPVAEVRAFLDAAA